MVTGESRAFMYRLCLIVSPLRYLWNAVEGRLAAPLPF